MTVLVVHSAAGIRNLVRAMLRPAGFAVSVAGDAVAGLALARAARPDLLIAEQHLTSTDGTDLVQMLRRETGAPLLRLSAAGESPAPVTHRPVADDVLEEAPCNPSDLLARLRAIAARVPAAPAHDAMCRLPAPELDAIRREIRIDGRDVPMRAKEFALLLAFLEHEGETLDRARLLEIVWGYQIAGTTRTVDVHVNHLRQKIAGSCLVIETKRGAGYRLVMRAARIGNSPPSEHSFDQASRGGTSSRSRNRLSSAK